MEIVSENITKLDYIDVVNRIIIQSYLIKGVLKKHITSETLDSVVPDHRVVYTLDFMLSRANYTLFSFLFKGEPHGFIIRNGTIVYQILGDKLDRISRTDGVINRTSLAASDEITEDDHREITEWYDSKSSKINYVNYSNIFYLGN